MKAASGPFADKLWREALRKAVMKRVEGKQNLDRIAARVVNDALDGNDKAYREIGDRLDGKPHQSHDVEIGANAQLLALIEGRLGRARGAA